LTGSSESLKPTDSADLYVSEPVIREFDNDTRSMNPYLQNDRREESVRTESSFHTAERRAPDLKNHQSVVKVHTPSAPQNNSVIPEEPAILLKKHQMIQCEQCGINLRIYQTGPHMCPECGIEFNIKTDGAVSFYEKL
jgi:hypothetical protein